MGNQMFQFILSFLSKFHTLKKDVSRQLLAFTWFLRGTGSLIILFDLSSFDIVLRHP